MSNDSPTAVNLEPYQRPGGLDGGRNGIFCGAPHPNNPDPEGASGEDEYVFCRLLKGHQTRVQNPQPRHSAHVFQITELDEWDTPVDLDA